MSKEVRDAIGEKVRKARKDQKLTQQQLARKIGLRRQMINRYENGRDAPKAENLGRILKYLGIAIDLPDYGYRLTAEALEQPDEGHPRVPQQLSLELDKPTEVSNANVRILPTRNSIEIVISGIAVGDREH
jgi:transcriptional regulator with XRE-family HTH domain